MNDPSFATFSLPRAKPPEPKDPYNNVTTLKMDDRIKAEVVTQYTTTDERTHTDALAAARHQVELDLAEVGQDWLNDDNFACAEDFANCCQRHAGRLLPALQRLAEIQSATPEPAKPSAPIPRPGRKR